MSAEYDVLKDDRSIWQKAKEGEACPVFIIWGFLVVVIGLDMLQLVFIWIELVPFEALIGGLLAEIALLVVILGKMFDLRVETDEKG